MQSTSSADTISGEHLLPMRVGKLCTNASRSRYAWTLFACFSVAFTTRRWKRASGVPTWSEAHLLLPRTRSVSSRRIVHKPTACRCCARTFFARLQHDAEKGHRCSYTKWGAFAPAASARSVSRRRIVQKPFACSGGASTFFARFSIAFLLTGLRVQISRECSSAREWTAFYYSSRLVLAAKTATICTEQHQYFLLFNRTPLHGW